MKKKVLITGANGFIGSFLVKEGLRRGYDVWAGVRSSASLERLPHDQIHVIDLKYNDEGGMVEQLLRHREHYGAWDYVVHNAGITKTTRPSDFFRINAIYTQTLLNALVVAGCKPDKFVLMSSLSSYGVGDEKNFRPIRLDDPQQPNTIYGKSKWQAEQYVRQSDIPYVILRPTGVYGPGDQDYLLEIQSIRSGFDFAVGLKPQRITFIYVKDLARVTFDVLENAVVRNRHYFVADGDVYTDTEFARLIQELVKKRHVFRARVPVGLVYVVCLLSGLLGRLTGKAMTLNTDKYKILKQRNWICDTEPLRRDLNFVPVYNLRKGLEETIANGVD